MMEKRSKDNMKAQLAANQTVVKQVSAYNDLIPGIEKLEELRRIEDSAQKVRSMGLIAIGDLMGDMDEEQKSAIQGTLAYAKAVLEGAEANEAYSAGLDELIEKGKRQKDLFKERQNDFMKAKRMEASFGKEALSTFSGQKEAQKTIDAFTKKKGKVTGGVGFKERAKNVFKTAQNVGFRERGFSSITGKVKNIGRAVKEQLKFDKKTNLIRRGWQATILFYGKMTIKYQLFMLKLAKTVRVVFKFLFKMLIMSMVVFMGLLIFMKAAYDVFEIFKSFGGIELITDMFYTALTMVGAFFGLIGAFITGDYEVVLEHLMTLIDGALLIVGNLALVALAGLGALLVGVFYTVIDTVSLFFTSKSFQENALKILVKFAKIYFIAWAVKTLAIQIAQLVALYAMPVLFVVSLAALLYAIVAFAVKKMTGNLPFMAEGGVAKGGMTVVGEKGPELVNLPKGARVHSNRDSKKMVAPSSGGNTINITINARDTSDAELRRIADKIGNMVNNKINRRTSSRTLG